MLTIPSPSEPTPKGSSADVSDAAARLRFAINRMARLLRQEAGGDLGPASVAALATIEREGPMTPSELAEAEGVKRPTVTRILTRLTELDYVARTQDPDDGRSAIVDITAEGRKALRKLRKRKTAYLAKNLKSLSAAELEAVTVATEVLERMIDGGRR